MPAPELLPSPPPRVWLVAGVLLILSLILCILGYLAVSVPGNWFSGARTLSWTGGELSVTRGSAQATSDGLLLAAPDAGNTAVISIGTSFRSSRYPVFVWDVSGVPAGIELGLVWRNEYAPGRTFTRPLTVEAGHVVPIAMGGDPNWIGTISGVALVSLGGFAQPMLVRGASARPMTAAQILKDRLGEWFALEHWTGASINTRIGGGDIQDLPLPFFVAAVVGLASALYWLLARWRPHSVGAIRASVIATLILAGWFVLDAQWEWNLVRQMRITYEQYAGKSWEERHMAAEDGDLFEFIQHVRAKLPSPPARVFMLADVHYLRDRGAYHLYPYNVYFEPLRNTAPTPAMLHPGDYVVAYQRKGVQFDAARHLLRLDAGQPVAAEVVLVEHGSALFRIRP